MFKYQTYFEKLSTLCPPKNYIAENKIAFRWIADMNGHFTHHPSINFTYFEKIIIVKSLK
jgi:hypothetical protein